MLFRWSRGRGAITGILAVMGISGLFLPQFAFTQSPPTECYRIEMTQTPFAKEGMEAQFETWCYQNLETPPDARMIYQLDPNGKSKPELSLIVESDGTITHASLLKDELTIHKLNARYNPLSVPLLPPEGAQRLPHPISPTSVESSKRSLSILTASRPSYERIEIMDGNFAATIAPESMPWRGYWFPHSSGKLHTGSNSPMAKYDRYVKARTGFHPHAQSWESANHKFTGVNWAGHCNGWAATSVLRKEPTEPWTDPVSGIKFNIIDIKGILMERDYCPNIAFFGRRYNGWRGDDPRDIYPHVFHNTLSYYIGKLKKPVLVDFVSTPPVENRVISSYEMNIERTGENTYRVEAKLRIHSYDTAFTNETGVANSFTRTYKYDLWTDESGNAIKGVWLSGNPDFLWVPLSPGQCKDSNPGVTENMIQSFYQPIRLHW